MEFYIIGEAYEKLHAGAQAAAAFERLLSLGPRDDEFRIAGLVELANILESKGSDEQTLRTVYKEIAASGANKDLVLKAQQKLKEL
jgi:hypothetical protein